MKTFKFLSYKKKLIVYTHCEIYSLKDIHNRNRHFHIEWSEYDGDNENHKEFEGNILEFYNMMRPFNITGAAITPKVYEIYFTRPGYFSHSKVYGNHHQLNKFISRAWRLRIIYSI